MVEIFVNDIIDVERNVAFGNFYRVIDVDEVIFKEKIVIRVKGKGVIIYFCLLMVCEDRYIFVYIVFFILIIV